MNKSLPAAIVVVLLSACSTFGTEPPVSFLGDPAPVSAATGNIVIGPDTTWVNVTGGDTIRFEVDGKSFAWTFNVARGISRFDLSRVAPPGVLNRRVDAYVAPDPRYIGGDSEDRSMRR
ncbi:MAG TPA: CzcE family metal-binding protein [Noviherbaspirillum sp.]